MLTEKLLYTTYMSELEYITLLQQEGFSNVGVHQDEPNLQYPDHTHPSTKAHIVLEGIMYMRMQGDTYTLRPGDRLEVPANTLHEATMGPTGCRYITGEKIIT